MGALVCIACAHPPSPSSSEEKLDDEKPIIEPLNEDGKLSVKFYYEALCPDSRLMLADLGREYFAFRKFLKLSFIPFGRAESLDEEGNEFTCHHGPKECYGNKLHSCGIKYLASQDARQQFVVCQMRTEADQTGKEVGNRSLFNFQSISAIFYHLIHKLYSFPKCFTEAGGDWSEVDECINGSEGKKLQLQAEIDTKEISKPRLKNVPTVVFSDVSNLFLPLFATYF